jgi:hypothetical protein
MMKRLGSASRRASLVSLAAAVIGAPTPADAQSSIGAQGFGYPPGQVSTRALGLGTSMAELDPVSPRNPASLARWGRSGLYLQYDPEFRRVTAAGERDGTVNIRFPLIGGATRITSKLSAGISISTLLDRTFTTESSETQVVGGSDLTATTLFQSAGGLNDVRLGVAYEVTPRFSVGLGGHVVTGENRIRIATQFDRDDFLQLNEQSEVNYSGTAFSGGLNWLPGGDFVIAGSMRLEGALRANRSEETLDDGRLPARAGVSVAYTGVTGAVFAAGLNWEQWSRMSLGSSNVRAQDTREIGLGVEVEGPRLRGAIVAFRGGFRDRGLPFGISDDGDEPFTRFARERAFSLGTGIPLATVGGASRAMLDLGIQRASRSGAPGVSERAWTLSLGLAVRP